MSTTHVIRSGEHISLIAHRYGFSDYRPIWNHAANEPLRRRRSDPNLVLPGDSIFIPDPTDRCETVALDRSHRVTVKMPRKVLRLKVRDARGVLLKDEPVVLVVAGERIEKQTDGEGFLEHPVPIDAVSATLRVRGHAFGLRIGELDPATDDDDGATGIQMRLANLGYPVGPIDGAMGARTKRALRAFQKDMRMKPTGKLDEATRKKLIERHGS